MRVLALSVCVILVMAHSSSEALGVYSKSSTCVRVRAELKKLTSKQRAALRVMSDDQIAVVTGHTPAEVKRARRCVASL